MLLLEIGILRPLFKEIEKRKETNLRLLVAEQGKVALLTIHPLS
jgi:hypothetical protein